MIAPLKNRQAGNQDLQSSTVFGQKGLQFFHELAMQPMVISDCGSTSRYTRTRSRGR
jgi:hypothetical protein